MSEIDRKQQLVDITKGSRRFMSMLQSVRRLELESWCIGAGAVRNLVWDSIHGYDLATAAQGDIDVAFFDGSDLSTARDVQLQSRLSGFLPGTPWEVTNQAGVHLWFEETFGYPVPALRSLDEAVGSWPEYATSVGLWLDHDDSVQVIAPHGLDDLFGCVVRHNPARASVETYRNRVEQKVYLARWPRVKVLLE